MCSITWAFLFMMKDAYYVLWEDYHVTLKSALFILHALSFRSLIDRIILHSYLTWLLSWLRIVSYGFFSFALLFPDSVEALHFLAYFECVFVLNHESSCSDLWSLISDLSSDATMSCLRYVKRRLGACSTMKVSLWSLIFPSSDLIP